MIEVYGARVRQARTLRRMTATAVAEEMGWSPSQQTKLEQAGTMFFGPDEVDKLSGLLRFPGSFFSAEPRSRVGASDLLFRAPKSMTKGEQEFLATFAALAGDFLDDLNEQTKLPPVRVPSVHEERVPVSVAALTVRRAMGLGADEPIDDLMYEVERIGAPIVVRRRGADDWQSEFAATASGSRTERHLGYSTWVGALRDRPLVVLRESDSWERTRFTIAHELGHLVLHSSVSCDVDRGQEEEANRFAAELLAPAQALTQELPIMLSLSNLKPMKDKWGLSLGSLIRHLRDSHLIAEDKAASMTRQLYTRKNPSTGHSWGMTEPGWDERAVEQPRLISKWVERCYGTPNSALLAARDSNVLPADVLEWFMATQRQAPSSQRPAPAPTHVVTPLHDHLQPEVIDIDRWRDRRG